MVDTLYRICLDKLVLHSTHIEDLSGVPFEPYLLDLLNYIFLEDKTGLLSAPAFQQQRRLKDINIANLLGRIADAHGSVLRQPKYTRYGSLCLPFLDDSNFMVEKYARIISQPGGAPQFITQLDLSMSWFGDDDIHHLKTMVNLVVLDLSATKITDYGVTHLSRLTQLDINHSRVGLQHLETLSLAYNRNITDGSLRYIPNMTALCGIDLSTTGVIREIATVCLKKHNYMCNETPPSPQLKRPTSKPATLAALATNTRVGFLARFPGNRGSRAYHYRLARFPGNLGSRASHYRQHQRKQMCPTHPLTLITHHIPNIFDNDKCNLLPYDPPHCIMTTNDLLYFYLTNDHFFGHTRHGAYDTGMQLWWEKGNGQQQPLVFTRPSQAASAATTITTSAVGKKRPLGNDSDGDPTTTTTTTAKASQPRSLPVKQSQNASSFIDNFQW